MFRYKTYEEADEMKNRISEVLLGINKNVVSVGTEEEKTENSTVYVVKIGLGDGLNQEKIYSILEHLKEAKIIDPLNELAYSHSTGEFLSAFIDIGPISALSNASAGDTVEPGFLTKVQNLFNRPRNQRYMRPVSPGISVGHENTGSGTIGAIITDQNGIHHILSNNHVLANNNEAKKGDKIIQPGLSDDGTEEVAKLEHFVPIAMQCPNNIRNRVDVAIAALNDQSKLNCVIPGIGEVNGLSIAAHIGMKIEKSGRTTGHTKGNVEAINADVTVSYPGGQMALFRNQIKTTKISDGGDSGSLLVSKTNNESPKAVGLLFAGSHKNSFANHYSDVDSALQKDGYHTKFAKSTINAKANSLGSLTFLYRNRAMMSKSLALSTLAGTIGLAAYAYNNRKRDTTPKN